MSGCFFLEHGVEDRGRITESIRISVPVDRMKQKCFQITTKRVRRRQQFLYKINNHLFNTHHLVSGIKLLIHFIRL